MTKIETIDNALMLIGEESEECYDPVWLDFLLEVLKGLREIRKDVIENDGGCENV